MGRWAASRAALLPSPPGRACHPTRRVSRGAVGGRSKKKQERSGPGALTSSSSSSSLMRASSISYPCARRAAFARAGGWPALAAAPRRRPARWGSSPAEDARKRCPLSCCWRAVCAAAVPLWRRVDPAAVQPPCLLTTPTGKDKRRWAHLGQKGVEAQDELSVPLEQLLDAVNHAVRVDAASGYPPRRRAQRAQRGWVRYAKRGGATAAVRCVAEVCGAGVSVFLVGCRRLSGPGVCTHGLRRARAASSPRAPTAPPPTQQEALTAAP